MLSRRFFTTTLRTLNNKSPIQLTLENKLTSTFGNDISVIDQSGGCGASFQINIVSDQFKGKRLVQQHKMVKSAIKEEMKEIHAVTLNLRAE